LRVGSTGDLEKASKRYGKGEVRMKEGDTWQVKGARKLSSEEEK